MIADQVTKPWCLIEEQVNFGLESKNSHHLGVKVDCVVVCFGRSLTPKKLH
uniref:Uncharacterized protein n=1 Tax=Rhizophora mucronata TaxID=61149 RepID=A0A2P2N666_RHIMU